MSAELGALVQDPYSCLGSEPSTGSRPATDDAVLGLEPSAPVGKLECPWLL
jgi:hypothetical protein